MAEVIDETGNRYGRLVVVQRAGSTPQGKAQWLCECDCGQETVVNGQYLRDGHTTSCGCRQNEGLLGDVAAFRQVLRMYVSGAKERGLEWALTNDQFRELTSGPCHYCGAEPSQEPPKPHRLVYDTYIHSGLDRKDSTLGYTPENVVPCCTICNRMKMEMGYDEFLDSVVRIARHRCAQNEEDLSDGL